MLEIRSKRTTGVLHKHPDPDAIVGGWQFYLVGEITFVFWGGGPDLIPSGEGFIPIDIGGGKFDHHPPQRFPSECAATLVAKELGFDKDPALKPILIYVKNHDLRGIRTPLDFADFVRCLNKNYPENPEKVLEISFGILDALYDYFKANEETTQEDRDNLAEYIESWLQDKDNSVAAQILGFKKGLRNGNRKPLDLTIISAALKRKNLETAKTVTRELLEAKYFAQQKFFKEAKEELKQARVKPIIRGKLVLNVVTVNSDNEEISVLARHWRYGYNAAIVIQRNSNGRTMIFTNRRFELAYDLESIVAAIRLEEQMRRKTTRQRLMLSFRKLTEPGHIKYIEQWYYQIEPHKGGGKLLNGSLTAPDVEPTQIPLERVTEIVESILELGRNFRWDVWTFKNYHI